MPDMSRATLLRTMSAGLPGGAAEILLQAAIEASGLQARTSFKPAEVGMLTIALLEMTELAADEVGMAAFEGAIDDELEESLDAILEGLGAELP